MNVHRLEGTLEAREWCLGWLRLVEARAAAASPDSHHSVFGLRALIETNALQGDTGAVRSSLRTEVDSDPVVDETRRHRRLSPS